MGASRRFLYQMLLSVFLKAATARNAAESEAVNLVESSTYMEKLWYFTPDYFPFPRSKIVMERTPGSCDLFWSKGTSDGSPCKRFAERMTYEPDPHVREVIASTVLGCSRKNCTCIDIGANIGYFTVFMASLGCTVDAIEPQIDLAEALIKTAIVNGWSERVFVHGGLASFQKEKRDQKSTHMFGSAWRMAWDKKINVTWWFPRYVMVKDILLQASPVQLVKVDTDSVDGDILWGIVDMVRSRKALVANIVTEFTGGSVALLEAFQDLGYSIYRLNINDDRRFFNESGHDIISRFQDIRLEPWYEEVYFMRLIRFAFKLKPIANMPQSWKSNILYHRGCRKPCGKLQYFLSLNRLEEPQFEHPLAKRMGRCPFGNCVMKRRFRKGLRVTSR